MQFLLLAIAMIMLLAHLPFAAYWIHMVNQKRAWFLQHARQAKAIVTEVRAPKKGMKLIRHEHGLLHARRWYVVARLADPTGSQEPFTLLNTKNAQEATLYAEGDVVDVWYAVGNPHRNKQLSLVEAMPPENFEMLRERQRNNQKNKNKILLGYAALVVLVAAGIVAAFVFIPGALAS